MREIAKKCDGIYSVSRWNGFRGLLREQKKGNPGPKIALILIAAAVILAALFPVGSAIAQDVDVGYTDFLYSSSATAPTGQKPQSKLWFNDNIWWGILYNPTSDAFEIYRLDWPSQTWSSTGVTVDDRRRSSADALWTGNYLYVASALMVANTTDTRIKVYQFAYDPVQKTYAWVSTAFIWDRVVETVVIDMDSTGTLWATFTDLNPDLSMSVFVTHNTTEVDEWVPPYVVPVAESTNLTDDDISTLVAYNGMIGVMWSNQTTNNVDFAFHIDGTDDSAASWTANPAIINEPKYADDHLNIKSLQADASGQLFAVVKTSLSDVNPSDSGKPQILLLILGNNGNWSRRTVSTIADNQTRPILLLDVQNREIYVFATLQTSGTSGSIYYKHISMDYPGAQFENGLGTPFISYPSYPNINNATSTKQPLTGLTDLVVMAGNDNNHTYYHNVIDLPDPPTPPTYDVFLPLILKN